MILLILLLSALIGAMLTKVIAPRFEKAAAAMDRIAAKDLRSK